jgi:hypothetical protein
MDIYYQKEEIGRYKWTWTGAHEVKVFGSAKSLASVKRRAKRLFPSEEIEFIPFRTFEGEVVPLSATESIDQLDPDE